MIEIDSVSKVFGSGATAFTALNDVSVTIRENEFFTLLGPSGCGKTTLLRTIAGFNAPSSGSVRLDGEDLVALPPYKRPVNTVFQNYALFPHMTVAENIGFGLDMLNRPKSEIKATVAEMLELVQMTPMADRRTSEISGGQQQRVALARALAPRPKVLLLDEPLSALDYKLRKGMQVELKRLQNETGITFVFVTHDQEEALSMSDRIAVMSNSRILQVGSPHDIYDHPAERFVAEFIGETNFLTGKIAGQEGETLRVALDVGGEIIARQPPGDPAGQAVTVAVRPEHAHFCAPDSAEATVTGEVSNVVYLGTDTHFHLVLSDGTPFALRLQNTPERAADAKLGDRVGIRVAPGVAQVLRD
ncbi:ABC transporter ATP-binding protein [Roseovarius nubinhibens]|uniref:Spermidine/putrescine import ATP-binding protein PotA n=1 Tax=Roseovarius nubinhibens (strain ATCC BAA-591 / DSM 15170 / ISM) TaxID=89187 RepID=A3SLJ9_ROSNI|nr:ABC transporter ATP-binding protein [Roseovarius nubinhibens]EAP78230.1 ABC transporter, ATP-binding component [Roseovarius nubinhibens ISM]MAO27168.1 ABC transporter ATP-binding protein [Roseovarius sp.]MBU3000091.1 ABC transporter ATP-binding protein [Roseovarius nubinhibens]